MPSNNDLDALQIKLNVKFNDISLLNQAFVHTSYLNEHPKPGLDSNERLEFLGDAVLGVVVAGELFKRMPRASEGTLTEYRALLVRKETLARHADLMGLGELLELSKGEQKSGGRESPRLLSSALEAVIGAIYLDKGINVSQEFILSVLSDDLEGLFAKKHGKGSKSSLQEKIQAEGNPTPKYVTIDTTGPDHKKTFTVEVRSGTKLLGSGTGKNKREAEEEAAADALEKLN
ncbi:MAG: ribonuclease III [Dehalococcoidia bacterium]|nr:ribonuclease III [Dehalococcoidia bacterium]